MSMNMIGRLAEKFGGQQMERTSGRLNTINPYSQPHMTDNFLKSSAPQKVEAFRSVFNRFQPQLESWKAKVAIDRDFFGKKRMTVQYGNNVKTVHNHRDLEAALREGEQFNQLSKSLPEGAQAISEKPNQLEIWLPGRASVVFSDPVPNMFEHLYASVPTSHSIGEGVSKFAEAQKLIEKFKANNR